MALSVMRLHSADIHLHRARIFHDIQKLKHAGQIKAKRVVKFRVAKAAKDAILGTK